MDLKIYPILNLIKSTLIKNQNQALIISLQIYILNKRKFLLLKNHQNFITIQYKIKVNKKEMDPNLKENNPNLKENNQNQWINHYQKANLHTI